MLERSIFKEICAIIVVFGLSSVSFILFAQDTSKKESDLASSINKDGASACSAAPLLENKYWHSQRSPSSDPSKIQISADKSQGSRQKMTLQGNVVIKSQGKTISADLIVYDQTANKVTIRGNVFYANKGTAVKADSGYKQIKGERAEFHNGRVWLESGKVRIDAQHVEIVNKSLIKLKKVTYSTCSDKDRFWELQASSLKINKLKGTAHAKKVVVRIKNIPVFYLPSLSFALNDQRKTGFLLPSIGTTDNSGGDVKIPFYWNIAPNRDATLTSRFLDKRGYQFIGEYRYLQENSKGILGLEYIPNDKAFNDTDRHLFYYRQRAKIGQNWTTDVDINSVSDTAYIEDLGNRITDTALTQLERRVDLKYSQPHWSVLTRIQEFQPLKGVAETYRRLPQTLLTANFPHPSNRKLSYHLQAEAVDFGHAEDVTVGTRFDIMPGLSYKLIDHPGYYLHSRFNYRYTSYDLDLGLNTIGNKTPERKLPILTLDSGLFFDRDTTIGQSKFTHTLEPRLFYLYVPTKTQTDLPVFDTSRLTLDINQLFRTNRYSGADRQGDANQITFALTSRFLRQDNSNEQFKVTLGQIYYFHDREVILPNENIETGNNSDAIAEIVWGFTANQKISATAQWDPDQTNTKVTIVQYQYKRDKNHLLNLAYRFREDSIEQTDFSSVWGLSKKWNAVARWNYSLRDDTTLEAIAGLEYNNCCWAIRLIGRSFIRDTNSEKENTVHLQFVLKGLAKLGDNMEGLLQSSILGYENTLD